MSYRWPPNAFPRMTHRRQVPAIFRLAARYRAIWQTEAESKGAINDWELDVLTTQAEMFVREVGGRPESGMTWRLSWIEEEMGLPDGEATGLDDDQRRDRICARLRSWRVPTYDAIVHIAQAYAGADVQVVMDYEAYHITIIFRAVPPNLADLESELIRIIPAHLGYSILVIYVTWGDCADVNLDWCQPEDAGWSWDYLENSSRDGVMELAATQVCAP